MHSLISLKNTFYSVKFNVTSPIYRARSYILESCHHFVTMDQAVTPEAARPLLPLLTKFQIPMHILLLSSSLPTYHLPILSLSVDIPSTPA